MSGKVFDAGFFDEVLSCEWLGRDRFDGASGFSFDSRSIAPGEVFVALETGVRDGHEFLGDAERAGAACALVSKPQASLGLPQIVVEDTLVALQELGSAWRKRWGKRIIAVTGSCGKTSTKELLRLLLGKQRTHASPGNLNNHIGVPLSLLLLREHHECAVIEAGINQGGEMDFLAEMISPEVGVVTTIGPSHLEKLGTLEGVASEKVQLPSAATEVVYLGPACSEYEAFTRKRFPEATWLVPDARSGPFGFGGSIWRIGVDGTRARLHPDTVGEGAFEFSAGMATPGMIENMGLAILIARAEGIEDLTIQERLESWRPASQRGEILRVGDRFVYADHYNANPTSFADAVCFFDHQFPDTPRCWVVGAMEELGVESAVWHRKLAAALPVKEGDKVFLVGDGAAEMAPILNSRIGEDSVRLAETSAEIADEVAEAPGTVFLKGSRKHKLEKVLDSLGWEG